MPITLVNALVISVLTLLIVLVIEIIMRNSASYVSKKKQKKQIKTKVRKIQGSVLCLGVIGLLIVTALQWRQISTPHQEITDSKPILIKEEVSKLVIQVTADEDINPPTEEIKQVDADSAEAYNKFLKDLEK